MLAALSNRFDGVEALREDAGLIVARALDGGRDVFLCHCGDPPGAPKGTRGTVAERLQALGRFGAPITWHEGPAGVTWVVDADDGMFLDDWLQMQAVVPLHDALRVLLDLAQALDALHRQGILHLRIRPTCVRIAGAGAPAARLIAVEAVLQQAAAHEAVSDKRDVRYSAPELCGRTGAHVDARADLYLLGLLAWRLLTNRLPFDAPDALGWLHAHLAVQPPALRTLRPDLPEPVAQLVHSLLAKSPGARPASTRVVLNDLTQCLEALEKAPHRQIVALRAHARFQAPQKLVGRETEREALRDALVRVGQGRVEAIALIGPSGIGKTALALDIEPEVLAAGGLFAMARPDQLGSPRPFTSLCDVLESLGQQLLRAPREIAQLGAEAGVLAALSPLLGAALGLRAADGEVPSTLARQRLLAALVSLFAELGREKPLVLLLDDLQWIDTDSLALLAGALSDRAVHGVMLLMSERAEAGRVPRTDGVGERLQLMTLLLRPLDEREVGHWIALALPGGLEQPLMTLPRLYARSAGNPLFLGELVKAMVLQGQLVPDATGRWHLDERAPSWDALPESALDAANRRLLGLADAELLAYAARLGARFDARVLALLSGCPHSEVEILLRAAEADALLECTEDGLWRFVHDRLQQAAHDRVAPETGLRLHLRIGRLFRDAADPALLFEVCRHLNLALPLLEPGEREELLRLNQAAGLEARARAGFAQYADLLRQAVALLPHATLSAAEQRALLLDAAEALLLVRDFDESLACLESAEVIGGDAHETARGAELRIQWLIAQERKEDALQLGLAALARIGLKLSAERPAVPTLWELLRLKMLLLRRPPAAWVDAAQSDDPRHVQTQRLLFATVSVAHTLGSPVYAALGLAGTRQAMLRGWTPWSSPLVSVAAHVISGVFGDIDTGYALGDLSVRLGERFATPGLNFNHLFYVMHWKVPLAQTLPQLRQSFEQAERAGNFEMAGYSAAMYLGVTWNAMHSLRVLDDALHEVRAFSQRHAHDLTHDCCETFTWVLGVLRGPALRGSLQPLRRERASGFARAHDPLFELVHDQLAVMLNVTIGHYGDDVVACGERVRRNLHRLAGNFSTALHHWFEALLHTQRLRRRPSRASRQLVQRHLRRLRGWSALCPQNHAHRVLSLEAELAALSGEAEAALLFSNATDLAEQNGFTGDAAIIAHNWARHCARGGDPAGLGTAMDRAHTLYLRWGATAMASHLEESLPAFARARETLSPLPLDTVTLVKASQAISAELEMSAVADHLLQQVMENTGARYGALLQQERGHLRLAMERGHVCGRDAQHAHLPMELLRGVQQTQKAVVLADATSSRAYGRCARWLHAPVSVLCMPIVAAGDTVGVLYLENELIAGCFTPDREMLAQLLASQAAIALSNARLFGELASARDGLQEANARLEERVAERTLALEENHSRLRQLERQHAAGEERQRIMSDLHDGLGSQLFVTLSRVERDELDRREVSEALRSCIADMRLVLEAMSPDGEDFMQAWGSFRFRWESQLSHAALASEWDDAGVGDSLPLASTVGLQVLRVAQEALTNVLKHAQARQVLVRLARVDGSLELDVADDGRGVPETGAGSGRGLSNMRARAARIGGTVAIESARPGTQVRLRLPLR